MIENRKDSSYYELFELQVEKSPHLDLYLYYRQKEIMKPRTRVVL